MKLEISLKIRYPDKPPEEGRSYGTTDIRDCYEQTLEVHDSEQVAKIVESVIKAFNGF